jgi:hypothetical protein
MDDQAGLERSDSGWDSEMIAYLSLYGIFLHNGSGFGRSGIGYAVANVPAEESSSPSSSRMR